MFLEYIKVIWYKSTTRLKNRVHSQQPSRSPLTEDDWRLFLSINKHSLEPVQCDSLTSFVWSKAPCRSLFHTVRQGPIPSGGFALHLASSNVNWGITHETDHWLRMRTGLPRIEMAEEKARLSSSIHFRGSFTLHHWVAMISRVSYNHIL